MRSLVAAREALAPRLALRRPQVEQDVFARVSAIPSSTRASEPGYVEGLRATVSAAVAYGLEADPERPVPLALLAQARLAARTGVSLDTVMRRYGAGHGLLADLVAEEAEKADLSVGELKGVLRAQAATFERVLAAVAEEYDREGHGRPVTVEERRVARVRSLLAGELVDPAEIAYEFDCSHVAVVIAGQVESAALRRLVDEVDRRMLLVRPGKEISWVWLGGRGRSDVDTLRRRFAAVLPKRTIALGEPAEGVAGWRLSHLQARAAFPVAQRSPTSPARYAEVALLASMLQDDLLATSLRRLYLEPLSKERDGGEALRKTLQAYFAAGRNASSAAAALGITRKTVGTRLRVIERRLGRPIDTCAAELETVLRLHDVLQAG